MNKIIYGADTETLNGFPLSLQFYSEQTTCDDIYFVNADSAREKFLRWCSQRQKDCQHVVYVHHLGFDLPEFLWGREHKLVESSASDFDFRVGKWRISGVFGGPTFAKITDGHHRTIFLIDTLSWYRGSLASAAKLFCPGLPKLARIDGLGKKKFTAKDTKFVDYAMRDCRRVSHRPSYRGVS